MQIHGPDAVVKSIAVRHYGTKGCQSLEFPNGVHLVMEAPEDCDEVIKAAVEAKERMLAAREPEHDHDDADLPWTTAHKFIPCSTCGEVCDACGRAEAAEVHAVARRLSVKCPSCGAPAGESCTGSWPCVSRETAAAGAR